MRALCLVLLAGCGLTIELDAPLGLEVSDASVDAADATSDATREDVSRRDASGDDATVDAHPDAPPDGDVEDAVISVDADEVDASECAMIRCAVDADHDGHGSAALAETYCGPMCPEGLAIADDCLDFDPIVSPSLAPGEYFHEGYVGLASADVFDYDCDGSQTHAVSNVFVGCVYMDEGCHGAGWDGVVPNCGEPGDFFTCDQVTEYECYSTVVYQRAACR